MERSIVLLVVLAFEALALGGLDHFEMLSESNPVVAHQIYRKVTRHATTTTGLRVRDEE